MAWMDKHELPFHKIIISQTDIRRFLRGIFIEVPPFLFEFLDNFLRGSPTPIINGKHVAFGLGYGINVTSLD